MSEGTDMPPSDKHTIWALAQGDRSKLDQAIAIHRKWIPTLGARGTPEQRYMAEVDHPIPDFGLRELYRVNMLRQREYDDVG